MTTDERNRIRIEALSAVLSALHDAPNEDYQTQVLDELSAVLKRHGIDEVLEACPLCWRHVEDCGGSCMPSASCDDCRDSVEDIGEPLIAHDGRELCKICHAEATETCLTCGAVGGTCVGWCSEHGHLLDDGTCGPCVAEEAGDFIRKERAEESR